MKALTDISIDEALDPDLLGATFGDLSTWQSWRVVLKAAFGITLNRDEACTFAAIAGSRMSPERMVRELWCIIGRRSGKSRVAALLAVFIALFIDHRDKLSAGEVGVVMVLAASRAQAAVVFQYCKAMLEASPVLSRSIEAVGNEEIKLRGGIVIRVQTTSYRTTRGATVLAAIFDEVAFWRSEDSATPDVEVYRSILPALATTRGMLIGISSPYAQRGLLYTKHRDAFGQDDTDVLIVKAPTALFNPTIDHATIEAAEREDPEAARSEWHAEFRSDLSSFVDRQVVEACIERGRRERGFLPAFRYSAFCDTSGGVRDSFVLAISHKEGERSILDLTREFKAPFDPSTVVDDCAKILRTYHCRSVTGDKYAAGWVTGEFQKHGLIYKPADKTRSEIYLNALPLLMANNVILLDDTRLVAQISQLERKTSRGGRDSVDHAPGAFDDLANAALGSLVYAHERKRSSDPMRPEGHVPKVILGFSNSKKIGQPTPIQRGWNEQGVVEIERELRDAVEKHPLEQNWWLQLHHTDHEGNNTWAIFNDKGSLQTIAHGRLAAERIAHHLQVNGSISFQQRRELERMQ